jgi:hypothetical protein
MLEPRRLLSFAASFLPGGAMLVAAADVNASTAPPPPGSAAGLGHENEVTIIVNPTNPRNVVAFAIDQALSGSGTQDGIDKAWYSFDGGLDYELSNIPNPAGQSGFGDPTAAFDRQGKLYYAHLTGPGFNISVAKSTDGGANWNSTVIAATVRLQTTCS